MNRYEFALYVAENTGFTREQIDGIKPIMQLILEKAEDKIAELEDQLAQSKDEPKQVYDIAEYVGVDGNLGMLAISLLLMSKSHELFVERGISEKVFLDSMKNIRVWTNTYAENYDGKLGMKQYEFIRFNLRGVILRHGRLEYQYGTFDKDDYELNGVTVKRGTQVINMHIPADGPFKPEDVEDSFRQAYQYYKLDEVTVFICRSWLLHPSIKVFCKPESNMAKFNDCFHIVEYYDYPRSGDLWRVFGEQASFDKLEELAENTSLQRSLKAFLLGGDVMGEGYGVFLHDGEKRL